MNKAVYFKGTNCGVCNVLLPQIEAHFLAHYPLFEFEVIDVENQPELAAQYGVFTVPVLLIVSEGKENFRFVRHFSTAQVDEKIGRLYRLMVED